MNFYGLVNERTVAAAVALLLVLDAERASAQVAPVADVPPPPEAAPPVELPLAPEPGRLVQRKGYVTITDHGGAAITSEDGAYELRIRGVVQTDLRLFVNDEHKLTDQFVFRRARPYIEGKIARVVTFRLMPDFAEGKAVLQDAWFDVRGTDALQLRVGKAKAPFGLERLVNDTAITLGERAYPTTLSPNRDIGVELHGDFFGGVLGYSVGVYNGVPDNALSDGDQDDSKEVVARLEVGPFARTRTKALQGLRVGFAMTRGEKTGNLASPYLTGYKTFGQNTFFSFLQDTTPAAPPASTTVAAGLHARETAQLYWPIGPIALLGEAVVTDERVARAGQSRLLKNVAWNGMASIVVTGEDATFDGPTPRHAFDLDQGNFGAVELAVRATELHVDHDTFPQFADPTKSARDAFEIAAGLNWYPLAQLKIVADFARTTFEGGASHTSRDAEQLFLLRTQLAF
ncbi:MAG: oprP [Myxococcaceae bacterium]|nr:oprP [Myxococcaceae bacterium]